MVIWVCDIPGADAATSAWHLALQLGLAAFVVVGGIVFLLLALVTYRRPVRSSSLVASTD